MSYSTKHLEPTCKNVSPVFLLCQWAQWNQHIFTSEKKSSINNSYIMKKFLSPVLFCIYFFFRIYFCFSHFSEAYRARLYVHKIKIKKFQTAYKYNYKEIIKTWRRCAMLMTFNKRKKARCTTFSQTAIYGSYIRLSINELHVSTLD